MIGLTISLVIGVQSRVGADEMTQYRLAAGDRIMVVISDQSDISGEFSIDNSGYIHMPLIGSVSVASFTVDECRQEITGRLQNRFIKNPIVSVQINEFRPVYVMGDVQTPGAYPFRFGLRLYAAIGLAGGFKKNALTSISDITAVSQALDRMETASATLGVARVRLARIKVEQAGKKTIDPTELQDPRTDSGELSELIKSEELQLVIALETHNNGVDLLRAQRPRLQEQMLALEAEIAETQRQLDSTKAFLERYSKLSEAGYARRFTELDLQRQESQQQATIHRLRADLSRLEIARGDLDIRIQELVRTRKARLMEELRITEARILELELALWSAKRTVELYREHAGQAQLITLSDDEYELLLIRFGQELATKSVKATKDALLWPGDIVEVRRKMPPDAVAIKALKLKINNDDLTGAAAYGQDRKPGEKTRDISKVTLH
jgi:polysaccharide export outer membrane protein